MISSLWGRWHIKFQKRVKLLKVQVIEEALEKKGSIKLQNDGGGIKSGFKGEKDSISGIGDHKIRAMNLVGSMYDNKHTDRS